MKPIVLLCLAGLAATSALRAAEEEKNAAKPAAGEEGKAPELPRVKAGDIEGVKKLVGKKAVVFGKVISSREVEKSGISFLDLDGGKFTVVCWKESYSKFEGGQSPAKLYKDRDIEVTGEIFEYKGKNGKGDPRPEIKLTSPDQVKVVSAEKESGAPAEKKPDAATDQSAAKKEEPKRVEAKKFFK